MSNQEKVSNQTDDVSNENGNNQNIDDSSKNETVDYATYKKLLGQHKNLKDKFGEVNTRLSEIEKAKQEAEQRQLEEQNQWKTIAEKRAEEVNEYKSKYEETTTTLRNGMKLNAFLTSLPAGLKKDSYMSFIDTDRIMLDEEGNIDKSTLEEYKSEWVDTFGADLLKTKGVNTFNGSPSKKGKLTHAEWLKLPLHEQRKKMKEVE